MIYDLIQLYFKISSSTRSRQFMPSHSNIQTAKISVIIIHWNTPDLIVKCLKSLKCQSLPPFEVIVIDNNSTVDVYERIITIYPDIRFIKSEKNLGFSAANNFAVQISSKETEWIALLNPDAIPEPDWLKSLVNASLSYPEFQFFGSRLMKQNVSSTIDGTGDIYHISGLPWRENHGCRINKSDYQAKEIFSPCAAAALYRKDIFIEAGGFDEDFFCYVEDVDLGFRLRLLNYRCMYVPDSVASHYGSASTGVHSDFSVYHGHRNLVWTFYKNMPSVLLIILFPFHIFLNLISICVFIMKKKTKLIFRAKFDSLKKLTIMRKKRKSIQSTRRASIISIWRMLDKRLTISRGVKQTHEKEKASWKI